jgi:hypothetical protein
VLKELYVDQQWMISLTSVLSGSEKETPNYYIGYANIAQHPFEYATTKDPVKAATWKSKEMAQQVARNLLGTLSSKWVVIEHNPRSIYYD